MKAHASRSTPASRFTLAAQPIAAPTSGVEVLLVEEVELQGRPQNRHPLRPDVLVGPTMAEDAAAPLAWFAPHAAGRWHLALPHACLTLGAVARRRAACCRREPGRAERCRSGPIDVGALMAAIGWQRRHGHPRRGKVMNDAERPSPCCVGSAGPCGDRFGWTREPTASGIALARSALQARG